MKQLVTPIIPMRVGYGQCLKQVRTAFKAPAVHATARIAADATQHRHYGRKMPNVAVPVWFDHWGTYDYAGYGKYDHVVLWVPERKMFMSSPKRGSNSVHWYGSLEAVERAVGGKYRFWSEDINGVRVVEPAPKPAPKPKPEPIPARNWRDEDDEMKPTVHVRQDAKGGFSEGTRAHPDIGKDLKSGQSRRDGKVTIYRGWEASSDKDVVTAWARTHANGFGNGSVHSWTDRAGYVAIQEQATRLSVAIHG